MVQDLEPSRAEFNILNLGTLGSDMARAFGAFLAEQMKAAGFANNREFGKRVLPEWGEDSANGYISRLVNGRIRPPRTGVDKWADALRLEGRERRRFMLLAQLARGPLEVESLVFHLEHEVADLRRRLRGEAPPPA